MSTARLDQLREIEKCVQAKWAACKVFELNAPPKECVNKPEKFFVTFPFPYMNGMLHLGHGFSLTKSEFSVRYNRMCGRQALWPFGLHVTGTPIVACAQKLRNEIAQYGNPPQFPDEVINSPTQQKDAQQHEMQPGQHKSKRGKVGPAKPQWLIMKSLDISDEEIAAFVDPQHWLNYFPALAVEDLKNFGVHVDWRRSFITTNANPFYDRFVKWQYRKLFAKNYLKFGKRYTIYSPLDDQPCADHDRASGEGVQPVEYTLIKIKVQEPLTIDAFNPFKELIEDKDVILPAATLRSETVCGTTNCWLSPDISYNAFNVREEGSTKEQIFIMTQRAAKNLSFQGYYVNSKQNDTNCTPLFEVSGSQLIGLPCSVPHCVYETVYTLPMFTISEIKGTAVVISVPSDSPDDYINFIQLKKKADYRTKLGIKDEWIMPYEIIPIITVPGEAGENSAAYWVKKLGINGPKDNVKLEEAKKNAYQTGYYNGVMTTGHYKGLKVSDAKLRTAEELCITHNGMPYYEPMKQVISRSGDDCVVALTEQWYIEYGKKEWKAATFELLKTMETYSAGTLHGFEETLNWFGDWPCSRTFGLGTILPADKTQTMLIDSLSDSTIYMCYYTVSRFFHMGPNGEHCMDARKPNVYGIMPEMMTDESWDYIFHGKGTPEELKKNTGLPAKVAEEMRSEFTYWYPVNLRVSAKDLIPNHLTMYLCHHAAIWHENPELWPRSVYCNGHVLVDNEKMSKSLGNFITLRQATQSFGADACRLACADAGDSLDDANFVRETAVQFILKMTTLIEQIKELVCKKDSYRVGEEMTIFDKIAMDSINGIISAAKEAYEHMQFRVSLNVGYYELTSLFSSYRLAYDVNDASMHKDVVSKYCNTITLLLQPLAPHVCEYIWSEVLGNKTLACVAPFPHFEPRNYPLRVTSRIINDTLKDMRAQLSNQSRKKNVAPVKEIYVYTATSYLPWQTAALELLMKIAQENGGAIPADTMKRIMASKPEWMIKEVMQDAMSFIALVRQNTEKFGLEAMSTTPSVDDYTVLKSLEGYLAKSVGVEKVSVFNCEDPNAPDTNKVQKNKCRPGEPSIAFPLTK